jgi:hypothetical protein
LILRFDDRRFIFFFLAVDVAVAVAVESSAVGTGFWPDLPVSEFEVLSVIFFENF